MRPWESTLPFVQARTDPQGRMDQRNGETVAANG
jgi:hypothetical protein